MWIRLCAMARSDGGAGLQFEWMRGVRESGVSLGGKALLLILSTYFDRRGSCWPSQARLARDLGFTDPRQVRAYVSEARDAGWITTERIGPRPMRYVMRFPDDYESPSTRSESEAWG